MRKIKTIKIDDRELTVKELTVRQVWGLFQDGGEMSARMDSLLEMACPELSRDVAMDMAPSELMQVWTVFKEVNADFLEIAKAVGLEESLKAAVGEIRATMLLAAPSVH